MGIEERLSEIEEKNSTLLQRVAYLEAANNDKWVSAKELAEIMGCSVNNIYIKIRSGEIYATNKLGSIPRIPMSQFYKKEQSKLISKPQKDLSIKEKVFGLA